MDLVEGIILGLCLDDGTKTRERQNADDRPEHGRWPAFSLGPMEEWFHLVAPGIEGDIIAKPAANCRQTVKLGISGFAAARLADALRSSSDALDFFDVA